MVEYYTLSNGVKIVSEYMAAVRSVAFGFWVSNGSKHETEALSGISHCIEHMLFKGTHTRTAKDIASEMDYVGGQINAFTTRECTCYHTRTIDSHFEKAFDVMADMFFNSVFCDNEIKKESQVIVEEINMYDDSPEDLAHELVLESVFKKHPLSYPILGTKETVTSFDSAKVKDYFKRNYVPASTVISIAGSFDKERILEIVQKYFGDFKADAAPARNVCAPIYTPSLTKKIKDVEQIHLCVTFPGIKHGADELYPLSILDTVFGGGMSSRLFQKIREEEGLVYSIYSCPTTYKETGIYSIYAGMGTQNAKEVLYLIMKEIKLLKTKRIINDEIQKTKEQIKSNYIIGLESTSNRMISLGRTMSLLNKVQTPDEIINKIDSVTIDKIYDVYDRIFDFNKICAAAVGNVSNFELEGGFS